MEAFKCDGCGRYFDLKPAATLEMERGRVEYITRRNTDSSVRSRVLMEGGLQLCEACSQATLNFIRDIGYGQPRA